MTLLKLHVLLFCNENTALPKNQEVKKLKMQLPMGLVWWFVFIGTFLFLGLGISNEPLRHFCGQDVVQVKVITKGAQYFLSKWARTFKSYLYGKILCSEWLKDFSFDSDVPFKSLLL